ncbi:hypothetical protein RSOLAG22IIIB_11993 [Rhizoctonia solani]|uniref:Uncharacterized protein n=1 Tax=Rhizoctonia solani TaxID=456999 RepID=A0A0K6GBL5_9AGAM|nr:hypothetical protein RSOLAG22IIIB_11993 [Rhizoctonia solani]
MAGTYLLSCTLWSASRPVGTDMWKAQAQPVARPSGGLIGRDDRKVPKAQVYEASINSPYSQDLLIRRI